MKFNFSKNLGFTLVELLVVIAIIGILSSVAVVNLNSAREKARTAAVEHTLASLLPIVQVCFSNDSDIYVTLGSDTKCDGNQPPTQPYEAICEGAPVWPDIEDQPGWTWGNCDSNVVAGTFSYEATNNSLGIVILCSETGCVTI